MLQREDRGVWRQQVKQRPEGSVPLPLPDRHQLGGVDALDGPLARGVEGAQAFEVLAEEFGTDGELFARTPGVDEAATDRKVAFLLNGRNAIVAHIREFCADRGEGRWGTVPTAGDCPQDERGDGPPWDGRGEGREGGDDDAGIGGQSPGLEGRNRLEARAEGRLVPGDQRRKLKDAGRGAGREEAEIVRQTVGVWKARGDRQHNPGTVPAREGEG